MQKHIGLRNPQIYEMEIRALLNLPVDAKVEQFDDTGQVMLHGNIQFRQMLSRTDP